MTTPIVVEPQPQASKPSLLNSNLKGPKLAVFGTFGVGNLGNECTLQAVLSNIRRFLPDAEVTCICSDPEAAAADYSIPAFPIRYAVPLGGLFGTHAQSKNVWMRGLRKLVHMLTGPYRWYQAFRVLKRQDALLIIGLGMLGDFGISAFGLHYDILGWALIAKLCGCKLEFVSVGVGPIRDPISRLFVKSALALGDYRSYRDVFSKEYLEGIHFSTKDDRVFPDLAFSLPHPPLTATQRRTEKKTIIGVGLIPYYGRRGRWDDGICTYRKYVESIAGLTCKLMDYGYAVRLLIGDARYDHEIRSDLRSSLEARGQQYLNECLIDDPALSVGELVLQLAATDLIVASRFHNVLLSILLGKPVVALSYHEKVASLMHEFGLSEFCHDVESFDCDKVMLQIRALETDRRNSTGRTRIERQVDDYREALNEQYELIFRSLTTSTLQ